MDEHLARTLKNETHRAVIEAAGTAADTQDRLARLEAKLDQVLALLAPTAPAG